MTLEFQVLGPVGARADGRPLDLGHARQRFVLAALLVDANRVVPADVLVERVWAYGVPRHARTALSGYVSRLRQVLADADEVRIERRSGGYQLTVDPMAVDLHRFRTLLDRAATASDADAGALYTQALELCTGEPLATLDTPWANALRAGLDEARHTAELDRRDRELASGRHTALLAELSAQTRAHPLDERLVGQHMLALYRSGRQADALTAYENIRRRLADELGADPGRSLQQLYTRILQADETLFIVAAPDPATVEPGEPLLERAAALAELQRYTADARRGDGRLVLLAGEAGVGKSALLERFRTDVPEARWWWSGCDGLFTPRPLGPLFDLADQFGGRLLELCRDGTDRELLFRALLREVGSAEVLDVVIVEDAHWADEATLDLLRFLGRRLRDTATLLIVTYRDDALAPDDPLRVALGDLGSQRSTRRIELAPLSPAAVELLAGTSGLEASELHRLTGGNPFYVTEVLQAGFGSIPTSARDAVLARAGRLSGTSRGVLEIAALMGTRVESHLLDSVAGELPAAIDDLLASGLLIADGSWLRFRHEIARLTLAQAVPAHRGRVIHQRVLETLKAGGADDARLAFHAEAAGDHAAVVRYASDAARSAAALGSHRAAADQLQRALRSVGDDEVEVRAGLYDRLAEEQALLDRWGDAADSGELALALWREVSDSLRAGAALRRLSRIRWNLGGGRTAVEAAEAAVSTLEPLGPGVELARAYATAANLRMLYSDYAAATDLAGRAEALAERLAATDVLSDALNTAAVCAAARGLPWSERLRRARDVALAEAHQDQAARAYANLTCLHVDRREFAEAERYIEPGLAYCTEYGLAGYLRCLRGEHARMLDLTGRWDDALALSAEIVADAGASWANRTTASVRMGILRIRRGDRAGWDLLDEAIRGAADADESIQRTSAHLARAEAYWLTGLVDAAAREAELADDAGGYPDVWQRGAAAVWLWRTGSDRAVDGEIAKPYRLQLDGNAAEAARLWTELDCPYDAALALADAPDESARRDAIRMLTDLGAATAAEAVRRWPG